ncbi:MAG: carbamoyl-phosphate synthase (glutamine-hydrolyzing) large subunit [Nitrososphaerota archaeon]|nr:carbamoyl-phosphate synthase (glutamine-hydrolyzing) large subunit [Candidatus Nezhaarchaeota archaeon]MDW8049737.1 carbamoyl-phosphate synthase (glutamine-hydrolyzing) large subunit [Nitrososphaerota archaeon]
MRETPKKVLILGSGAIKIGEAGEFDYSGSQALKAVREEGIETVLVNPNIATIQTDPKLAGKVYLVPVIPEFVAEVIERERPDGIMLGFGGQTALNCGVLLHDMGILDKYGVKVLGTSVESIKKCSDRLLFKRTIEAAGLPMPRSKAAYSIEEALEAADDIGYPVMVRVAYTLGGKASGIAKGREELKEIVRRGLAHSLISQVLIEECISTWKQIEYEVMRDYEGNSVTVCNMENILGMRVHTGDNIVVAPSQTITNREYHILRLASLKAAETLKIVGECNVQLALEPNSERFSIIEINPRLSRSSALASKATGYPLAYMAAKLALGYKLHELINKVTGKTTACFEPALDYVVLKFPRWDFQKFEGVDRRLGTQMKSVGEVMAIGRCFEEALQKAIRMLDIGKPGLIASPISDRKTLELRLREMTDEIIFDVAAALKAGFTVEEISKLTSIDPWFIEKIRNIVVMEEELKSCRGRPLDELAGIIREAKRLGFSDKQIANCLGLTEDDIRNFRVRRGIIPVVKQIDTLAAEWPAQTNYLYVTYGGNEEDIEFKKNVKKVIVLGAGTYRIGSSVEFDWCTMNMVWALKERGIDEVIVINYNPETVSTDYDMSDKLYFEELTLERVFDICYKEDPWGVVACVGGQISNNLAPKLEKLGIRVLGTAGRDVDRAEDRAKFSKLLDELGIPQPPWAKFASVKEAEEFAEKVGYPVLVRPSYVLSGAAMRVAWTPKQLREFLLKATSVSPEHPVVISKFIEDALEVEVDAVSDGETTIIGAIIEHVERAGVHSGDAIMVIPPQMINYQIVRTIKDYTKRIAKALNIKGPFNIQFLVKDGVVYVIECNLRASRSMPFVSKVKAVNLMKLASYALLGEKIPWRGGDEPPPIAIGVKAPQFSFMQLEGADPILGVEMQSTGEVACLGETFPEALYKALLAAGFRVPISEGNILITVGGVELKKKILPLAKGFKALGYNICATEHTAEFLIEEGLNDVKVLYKVSEPHRKPNIMDALTNREINLVINIPSSITLDKYVNMLKDEYTIRRKAVELGIPVVTTLEAAYALLKAVSWRMTSKPTAYSLNDYMDKAVIKVW